MRVEVVNGKFFSRWIFPAIGYVYSYLYCTFQCSSFQHLVVLFYLDTHSSLSLTHTHTLTRSLSLFLFLSLFLPPSLPRMFYSSATLCVHKNKLEVRKFTLSFRKSMVLKRYYHNYVQYCPKQTLRHDGRTKSGWSH